MNSKKVTALNLSVSRQKTELPVPQAHGAKVSYAAPGRVVQQDRILGFRRHPHLTPGAVLLEVDFVGGPQIYTVVLPQRLEFFLCAFCRSGSACAITGRGLRIRNPNCRNSRWHCLTPRLIPYSRSIQRRQRLSVPQIPAEACLSGHLAQNRVDFLDLLLAQSSWPPGSIALQKSSQPHLFKLVHPILHRSGCVPQQFRRLRACHTLRHEQHAVQSMIIARFFRSSDLVL